MDGTVVVCVALQLGRHALALHENPPTYRECTFEGCSRRGYACDVGAFVGVLAHESDYRHVRRLPLDEASDSFPV